MKVLLLDGVGIWVENKINPLTSTKTIEQITAEVKTNNQRHWC